MTKSAARDETGGLGLTRPAKRAPAPEGWEVDGRLVERARAGEARAFEQLLSRHEPRVLRVLRLLGIPADDREDLAQEVFLRVFRHLGRFRTGRPFERWIYRIAVNVGHDHRARRARRGSFEQPRELEDAASQPGSWGTEVDDGRLDLRRQLLEGLETLSARERAVFVLRELEGLETREVARTLGITSVTVRRHLGRARARLRRWLES